MTKKNSTPRRKRSALPGGVRQLKSGRWQLRVQAPDGARLAMGTFPSRTDAEIALAQAITEIGAGTWIDPRTTTPTLDALADAWFARRMTDARDPDVSLRESTVAEDIRTWELMIQPHLGEIEVANLTFGDVQGWFDQMRSTRDDRARTRTTRSVNRCSKALGLIARVLDQAMQAGQVEANVARLVKLPRSAPRKAMKVLSLDQLHAVASTLDEMVPEHNAHLSTLPGSRPTVPTFAPGLLVRTIAMCGAMRWGEVAALKVGDVCDGQLRIERSLRKGVVGQPKTPSSIRTVGIPDDLADDLAAHVEGRDPEELLFTSTTGARISGDNFRGRWWVKALERAGLDPKIRLHDLRHTGVSLALAHGIPAPDVARWCGHSSPAMTLSVYAHALPDRGDVVVDAFNAMASGKITPIRRAAS